MNFKTAVWDLDYIRYAVGFACEKRNILVINRQSGDEAVYNSRTAFYGRGKAKDGGALAEINKSRDSPYTADEFDIFDQQVAEPIDFCLHTVKQKVELVNKILGVKDMIGYHGVGASFRLEASTVLGYKMNRENNLKPIHIDAITEYIVKKYKSVPCSDLEADDWCTISSIESKDRVQVSADKDSLGTAVYTFNPTKPELGVRDGRGFGSLWIEERTTPAGKIEKTVRGIGRMFFYQQWASLDTVDNYRANAASPLKWGEMSAYNALKDCKNDKEALAAVVGVYKHLYQETYRVQGWREGSILDVDWKYMISENFILSRMLRTPDEKITAEEVFTKFGLWKD